MIDISTIARISPTEKGFCVPVELGNGSEALTVDSLVDTGGEGFLFIDYQFARSLEDKMNVSMMALPKPKECGTFNGKKTRPITHAIYLPMKMGDHYVRMNAFYVVKIAKHPIIVGRKWLKQHGALLDAVTTSVMFRPGFCQHEGATPITAPSLEKQFRSLQSWTSDSEKINFYPQSQKVVIPQPKIVESASEKYVAALEIPKYRILKKGEKLNDKRKAPKRAEPSRRWAKNPLQRGLESKLLAGAPWMMVAREKGAEVFAISMKEIDEQREKLKKLEDANANIKNLVPEEYHAFLDVFDHKKAYELPPHRPRWDHEIVLKEGAVLPKTDPLRRQSPEEFDVLKEYVINNLGSRFIEPSQAEYGSPILFVKKPSGGLRLCIDYRKINEITKRNRYPLPLIDETIARVTRAKIYTKLDVVQAFHNLRLASEKSEELSTFICRLGAFKYKVMPFGLTNAPATFQQFMNDHFNEYSEFVSAFLDDLLIYSQNMKEHREQVKLVLSRLREMGLRLDILKCEFHVTEVKFLGLVVTPDGVKMDPKKVAQIKSWTKPKNGKDLKGIRGFLGFVNFYRRFIKGFAKIARPLYNLLMKESPGIWDDKCDGAFEGLKEAVTTEPVMMHFDRTKEAFLECDSSDLASGGVLSQLNDEGWLRPVAYLSQSLDPAQRNYVIYDKEMLAIVRCFEEWRPELLSVPEDRPTLVMTDHKALEHFMTTKQLNRRQARWAEFLSQFNFKISYRPGAKNLKADLLTRQPCEGEVSRAKLDPHMNQTLLPSENLSEEVKQDLGIHEIETNDEKPVPEETTAPTETIERSPLAETVEAANRKEETFEEVRRELQKLPPENLLDKIHGFQLRECTERNGVLYYYGKLVVPDSLTTEVIRTVHSGRELGHAGVTKTLKMLRKDYCFTRMTLLVRRFIRNCHDCKRSKPKRSRLQGLLRPLPIPQQPWEDISVDFVGKLPEDSEKNNTIMMVVCHLTKERHFISFRQGEGRISAETTAWMFYTHIWRLHGLPRTVVSDRGTQFASMLWQHLCKILKIKAKLSTAFHPESDGQTENANQEMERYLRTFVNYEQSNWGKLLPSAEFAANVTESESTQCAPFMASRGLLPRMSFDPEEMNKVGTTARERIELGKAKSIATEMKKVWEWAGVNMRAAQERQKRYADASRREVEDIEEGDEVWLDMRNITTKRPSKKLDSKWEGPFKVLKKKNHLNYEIDLPCTMGNYRTFHASLLAKDPNDPLPGQEHPLPGPIEVAGEEEFEVEEILDVRKQGRGIIARASWVGHPPDLIYYPIDNFRNSAEYLDDYYRRNPSKPKPPWLKDELMRT